MSYIGILFTFIFAQNVVLQYFLGVDHAQGASKNLSRALVEGLLLTIVCSLSALVVRTVYVEILLPLGLSYLCTLTGILLILTLGKLLEVSIRYLKPILPAGSSYDCRGITLNSLVFGIVLLTIHRIYDVWESLFAGIAAGLGYLVAVLLLGVLREQFQREWIPRSMQGTPILFISAGLIAMAFMAIDSALLQQLFR